MEKGVQDVLLAKGGIAVAFARWQQQFALAVLAGGSNPRSPILLGGQGPPSNTMSHCACRMASKSVKRVEHSAQM